MFNTPAALEKHDFYELPFEENSFTLKLETLERHTNFGFFKKIRIKTRKVSFRHEILTIGVIINDSDEEQLYLKVTKGFLLVSCSVDTSKIYLSYTAYCGLVELMSIYKFIKFDHYYWPGFFDEKTGTSKYLDIINDRQGLDVKLKSEFNTLYRPYDFLLITKIYPRIGQSPYFSLHMGPPAKETDNVIGFCMIDCHLTSWHSVHLPLLFPFKGVLTLDKSKVKSFIGFTFSDGNNSDFSHVQSQISQVSIEMISNPCIDTSQRKHPKFLMKEIDEVILNKFQHFFSLWHNVYPKLMQMHFSHYYETVGFNTVRIIPQKNRMIPCKFLPAVPKIVFQWKQFNDYYELVYFFEINGALIEPFESNTAFFVSAKQEPYSFYLLGSLSDALITLFFAERKFKIQVLKKHYHHFGSYFNWLRSNFGVRYV